MLEFRHGTKVNASIALGSRIGRYRRLLGRRYKIIKSEEALVIRVK